MTTPLRPMNTGEILDRTFQINRSKFLFFTGIAMFPALMTLMLTVADETAFILAAPFYLIALTLFYYHRRIRLEGYDIERMMEDSGMNAPQNPLLEGPEPPAPVEEAHS